MLDKRRYIVSFLLIGCAVFAISSFNQENKGTTETSSESPVFPAEPLTDKYLEKLVGIWGGDFVQEKKKFAVKTVYAWILGHQFLKALTEVRTNQGLYVCQNLWRVDNGKYKCWWFDNAGKHGFNEGKMNGDTLVMMEVNSETGSKLRYTENWVDKDEFHFKWEEGSDKEEKYRLVNEGNFQREK